MKTTPRSRSIGALTGALLLAFPCSSTAQSWKQLAPPTKPTARNAHGLSGDFLRRRVLLFGGVVGAAEAADTWEWDGQSWTQKQPTTSPPAVRHHGLSFDAGRLRHVFFGGRTGSTWRNETWEWNGVAWTQAMPATSPSTRYGHGQGYDWARRQTVVFGGIGTVTKPYEVDTWVWDGTNWTQAATSGPAGRIYPAMAYDTTRGVLVMFAGYSQGNLNDTWEWDGTKWTQITTPNSPPARWGHAMCYDMNSKRIVMFGGNGGLADTWSYDGKDWTQLTLSPSPAGRQLAAMAYDGNNAGGLLFGGSAGGDETWVLSYGSLATYVAYGQSCTGSAGSPTLGAASGSLPWINSAFGIELTKIPATSPAVLVFGISDQSWGAIPLPLKLDGLGMTGCWLNASVEVLFVMTNNAGTATITLPLPNDLNLVGARFYNQGLVLDPPANSAGLTTSNGAAATIGKK